MRYLFLAEKPSTMKAIKDVYNRSDRPVGEIDFLALSGHVCKLSEPKSYEKWNVKWRDRELPMIPQVFKVEPLRQDLLEKIRNSLAAVHYDAIIVGTDSDVEGNGIYDLLETYLGLSGYKTYRFFESDLTPGGIMKSIQNLTDYHTDPRDTGMTQAYRIRSRFDWLIGFNMSVACTVKSGFLMKVGRVKAPTLKLVYDNCAAIDRFQSKTAYQPAIEAGDITAGLVDETGKAVSYPGKKDGQAVIDRLSGTATVREVRKERKKSDPDQLYKLTDIQYEAGVKYGYTPEKTLELIQSLYETHKLISYPRTDGRYVSSEKARDFPRLLKAVAAMNGLEIADNVSQEAITAAQNNKRYVNDAEVQKSSHDALLPTGETAALPELNRDERNICDMIFRRFLAIFLPPLEEEKTRIVLEDNGYQFLKNGSRVIAPGYTLLFKPPQETILPEVTEEQQIRESRQFLHEVVSRPPKRLTQASLLKEMENISRYITEKDLKNALKRAKGIGQPSSRANIIAELVSTGYIRDVKGKGLFITDEGKAYIENLGESSIVSPKLSAEWEMHMEDIREGTASYDDVYRQILDYLREALAELDKIRIKNIKTGGKQIGICPVCGKPVVELPKGWGCSGYPGCKFAVWKKIAGRTMKEKEAVKLITDGTTGELSGFQSKEGKPFSAELVIKDGNVAWAPFEKPTDLKCPKCGENLVRTSMSYKCPHKDCGFILWKNICGHTLSEDEVRSLLTKGKTGMISGFVNRDGKPFSSPARLVIQDFKLVFEFQDRTTAARDTGIACPKCGGKIVRMDKVYKCQEKTCDFILWPNMTCNLQDDDVRDLAEKKETRMIDGFINRKGKRFSAKIVLNQEGKADFCFRQ